LFIFFFIWRAQTFIFFCLFFVASTGKFRSDGQRIAGSACDYQFISIGGGVSGGSSAVSRHNNQQQQQQQQQPANKFYSPLYPSLYPARSRCLYHFYGR
jgi:hypothetical protein